MTKAEGEAKAKTVIEEHAAMAGRRVIVLGYVTEIRQALDAITSLAGLYDDVMEALSAEDVESVDGAITNMMVGLSKF